MQKWKTNSLKNLNYWEKISNYCLYKLNLRLQKDSASLAIKQMQSLLHSGADHGSC